MTKDKELSDPNSCINKALSNEMTFTLLARDVAAPFAIREWVRVRILAGLNKRGDPLIEEAEACAHTMELQRDGIRAALGKL